MRRNKYRKIISLVMALMVTVSMQPVNLAMAQENFGEVSAETTAETEMESETETETDTDTESASEPDASPDTESDADAEQMTVGTTAETEMESASESDSLPETESDADAEQTTAETTAEAEIESNILTVTGMESVSVISVTVTWGAMEFTYHDAIESKWNPDTHTYDETTTAAGGWQPTDEGGNQIQVTDEGTESVSVSYSFTASDSLADYISGSLTGTFTRDVEAFSDTITLAAMETDTVLLELTGEPKTEFSDITLGTVTVTITAVDD